MNIIQKMIQGLKDQHSKVRWFIQYPIPKNCNLRCEYCFHQKYFKLAATGAIRTNPKYDYYLHRGFTLEEWNLWFNTYIKPNSAETIIHLQGGDPFCEQNLPIIFEFMDNTNHVIDILTNGLGNTLILKNFFEQYKNRIHRIGFTYHRKTLSSLNMSSKFRRNVKTAKHEGINVYVKEILFKDEIENILKHREYWNQFGIPLKIQDFQALDAKPQSYTIKELNLISNEYKHKGAYCSCWDNWKSISIRGYDFSSGDVVACWLDPKVIGNIADNTFNPNFKVYIDTKLGRRNVIGVPTKYSNTGTYERDRIDYVT